MFGRLRGSLAGALERRLVFGGIGLVALSGCLIWHSRHAGFAVAATVATLDRPAPLEAAFSGDSRFLAVRYEDEVILSRIDGAALEVASTFPLDPSVPATLLRGTTSVNMVAGTDGDQIDLIDLKSSSTIASTKIWFQPRKLQAALDGLVMAEGKDPRCSYDTVRQNLHVTGSSMHLLDDDFWSPRIALGNGIFAVVSPCHKCSKDDIQVIAGDIRTNLHDAHSPDDKLIGFIDDGTWNGILVFTHHCHALRLFATTGEEIHRWKVDPRLDFIAALDERGTLAGFSNDPDTVWVGTISGLPNLSPMPALDSSADPDHFETSTTGGVFWAFLDKGLPTRELIYVGESFINPLRMPSQVVFFRPDASKSPLRYNLSDNYLMTKVSPCGRFAAIVFGGQKGKVVLLDLTRPE